MTQRVTRRPISCLFECLFPCRSASHHDMQQPGPWVSVGIRSSGLFVVNAQQWTEIPLCVLQFPGLNLPWLFPNLGTRNRLIGDGCLFCSSTSLPGKEMKKSWIDIMRRGFQILTHQLDWLTVSNGQSQSQRDNNRRTGREWRFHNSKTMMRFRGSFLAVFSICDPRPVSFVPRHLFAPLNNPPKIIGLFCSGLPGHSVSVSVSSDAMRVRPLRRRRRRRIKTCAARCLIS